MSGNIIQLNCSWQDLFVSLEYSITGFSGTKPPYYPLFQSNSIVTQIQHSNNLITNATPRDAYAKILKRYH